MALSRCLKNHASPKGKIRHYVAYVYPIGYPDTAIVCGLCRNPGVIWLDSNELALHNSGERIFEGPTKFTKIKVSDCNPVMTQLYDSDEGIVSELPQ